MNKNIFEHHFNNIEIKSIQNSLIYIVDNFYKYPEEILNIIKTNKPNIHKEHEKNSFNQIHFYDHRHFLQFEGLESLLLSRLSHNLTIFSAANSFLSK